MKLGRARGPLLAKQGAGSGRGAELNSVPWPIVAILRRARGGIRARLNFTSGL